METKEDAEKHVAEIREDVDDILRVLDDTEKQGDDSKKRKIEHIALERVKKVISWIQIHGDRLETTINGSKKFKQKISALKEDDTIRAQKHFLSEYIPFREEKSRQLKRLQRKLTRRDKVRKYVAGLKQNMI
ncbi:MAG: hypothetical protein A7316_09915 [Candidatus Altiarchaeales archaeon WOR_SM1_86-2]|nr:MAG: hypothetical protein A7316_09915 [Candidatus Altiarchaeales archaeon WOR_SM1_86-2]ODS37317.1 MAG: hypothetical protein A7315_04155 [Candidatus Altiarchaeales archaeon WOR_SM1_79]